MASDDLDDTVKTEQVVNAAPAALAARGLAVVLLAAAAPASH